MKRMPKTPRFKPGDTVWYRTKEHTEVSCCPTCGRGELGWQWSEPIKGRVECVEYSKDLVQYYINGESPEHDDFAEAKDVFATRKEAEDAKA